MQVYYWWVILACCSLNAPPGTWNVLFAYITMAHPSPILLMHCKIFYLAKYSEFWKMSSWFGQVCQIVETQLNNWALQTHIIKSYLSNKQTNKQASVIWQVEAKSSQHSDSVLCLVSELLKNFLEYHQDCLIRIHFPCQSIP